MKWIALLLIVLGATLASSLGALNTPNLVERQQLEITAKHFETKRDNAHKAYCDARKSVRLPDSEECIPDHWKTVVLKEKDLALRLKAARSLAATLKAPKSAAKPNPKSETEKKLAFESTNPNARPNTTLTQTKSDADMPSQQEDVTAEKTPEEKPAAEKSPSQEATAEEAPVKEMVPKELTIQQKNDSAKPTIETKPLLEDVKTAPFTLYLSQDGVLDESDVLIHDGATPEVGSLNDGLASADLFALPHDTKPGQYNLLLMLDPEGAVAEKRTAWIDAFSASIEPASKVWAPWAPPAPLARLTAWFRINGLLFGLGLFLVVIGGLLARKVARGEATAESSDGKTEGAVEAVDFGELLRTLNVETKALHTELTTQPAPYTPDLDEAKARIEVLQMDRVDRLVDARMGLQTRYGMAGFAQVFGPMSAGERNLNRTWSALVDNHWPEAMASLAFATTQFEEACQQMERIQQPLS